MRDLFDISAQAVHDDFNPDGTIPRGLPRGWMPPAVIGAETLSVIPRVHEARGLVTCVGAGRSTRYGSPARGKLSSNHQPDLAESSTRPSQPGARDRTRTGNSFRKFDFKSKAYTYFATRAGRFGAP